MLVLPLLLGQAAAGGRSPAGWSFSAAVIAVFLAHYALVPIVERRLAGRNAPADWSRRRRVWGAIYFGVALALFAATVGLAPAANRSVITGLATTAAVLGAVYFTAACLGAGRRAAVELVGMVAMSVSAPIVAFASGRPFSARPLGAAVLAVVYSASALSFVRAFGAARERRGRALVACLAQHAALVAIIAWVARDGWLPSWWWISFVPLVARVVWGFVLPPPNLRRLGLREIWVALTYAVLAVALVVAR